MGLMLLICLVSCDINRYEIVSDLLGFFIIISLASIIYNFYQKESIVESTKRSKHLKTLLDEKNRELNNVLRENRIKNSDVDTELPKELLIGLHESYFDSHGNLVKTIIFRDGKESEQIKYLFDNNRLIRKEWFDYLDEDFVLVKYRVFEYRSNVEDTVTYMLDEPYLSPDSKWRVRQKATTNSGTNYMSVTTEKEYNIYDSNLEDPSQSKSYKFFDSNNLCIEKHETWGTPSSIFIYSYNQKKELKSKFEYLIYNDDYIGQISSQLLADKYDMGSFYEIGDGDDGIELFSKDIYSYNESGELISRTYSCDVIGSNEDYTYFFIDYSTLITLVRSGIFNVGADILSRFDIEDKIDCEIQKNSNYLFLKVKREV